MDAFLIALLFKNMLAALNVSVQYSTCITTPMIVILDNRGKAEA